MVEPTGGVDAELQRSFAQTLRYGTPPPTLGISQTMTKLTFGLLKSLENMSLNPSGERMEVRSDLGMGYANNEFYLPIAGCPSVSELEPQLTNQLTLKGNRAKLLNVPLWHHTYYTSSYLINDITGELYACHQGELIVIKEQGYLQKEMAEEEYLNSQGKGGMVHLEWENNTQPKKVALVETRKVLPMTTQADENIVVGQDPEKTLQDELAEQNKKTIMRRLQACYKSTTTMPIDRPLSNGISREGRENNWREIYFNTKWMLHQEEVLPIRR